MELGPGRQALVSASKSYAVWWLHAQGFLRIPAKLRGLSLLPDFLSTGRLAQHAPSFLFSNVPKAVWVGEGLINLVTWVLRRPRQWE